MPVTPAERPRTADGRRGIRPYDAIVVGSGHNGLVAALYLARAGRRTLVLERNDVVGGAMRSAELVRPGFVHDVYSTNMNLFLACPAMEFADDLARHGMRFAPCGKAYASVYPDETCLKVYQDVERTLAGLRAHHPADAQAFERLYGEYRDFRDHLLPIYGTPLPSAAAARVLARAARRLGPRRMLELAQLIFSSTRAVADGWFATEELKALVAPWGMHLDFAPDVPGGGLYLLLTSFSDMEHGMNIVEGGAGRLPEAMAGLLREWGGEVRTGAEVTRVVVENGAARGVELAGGEVLRAPTVVSNVTPQVLFDRLVPEAQVRRDFTQRLRRYRFAPGCMMIHLALREPLAWAADPELAEFSTIHVGPYLDDMARTYQEVAAGLLPTSPMLIVGQTSSIDPTRVPDGAATLYIQVRNVPSVIRGDAGGEIDARDWDAAKEPMADRILAKLEAYAPGLHDRILGRAVLSPDDLERDNPNLVGGDSESGSHHPAQNFLFRPMPGWTRYRTPVDGLYMVGAGTWPGGGNNGLSGYHGARAALGDRDGDGLRGRLRRARAHTSTRRHDR